MKIYLLKTHKSIFSFLFLAFPLMAGAQEYHRTDTLPAAVKRDTRTRKAVVSERIIIPKDFFMMVTPTGEADFVKYIQTLPGVAGGSDGSSSYYVRGGNMGGNVQTLDGVTVYGASHLIGLTSAYPSEIVSSAEFQLGGFSSEEGNLSSSHIKLFSKDGSFDTFSAKAEISNFMLGAYISTPIVKSRLSLNAAVRYSPAAAEYKLFFRWFNSETVRIQNADAAIYDAYAKLKFRINPEHSLALSYFHSTDNYSFHLKSGSQDMMSWTNHIALLQYDGLLPREAALKITASYNHYDNAQGMQKMIGQTDNNLMIRSLLDEAMLHAMLNKTFAGKWNVQLGLKGRFASFDPGSARILETTGLFPKTSSPLVSSPENNYTVTLHGQVERGAPDRHFFRVAGRLNYNSATKIAPEGSALVRLRLHEYLGLELTGDWLVQYYHTLEGIPLGWSLDMIIPPSAQFKPETTAQLYAGLNSNVGNHHFSLGAYYKRMNNLVYFSDASKLFDSSTAGWKDNIETGSGTSRGLEFSYEKTGEIFTCRVGYTLSKTDRLFPNLNKGEAFPAKYDRTHILNTTVSLRVLSREKVDLSISGLFTWQSGHMETVTAGSWWFSTPILGYVEQDFYTSFNNYRMPPYIRCDLSAVLEIKTRFPQTVHVGVYNVFNRHNPFTLSYDPDTKQWQQISLLPIMPSLKYSITF